MGIAAFLMFGAVMFWIGYDWGRIREYRRETERQRASFQRTRGVEVK